jgi:hypothetical protein
VAVAPPFSPSRRKEVNGGLRVAPTRRCNDYTRNPKRKRLCMSPSTSGTNAALLPLPPPEPPASYMHGLRCRLAWSTSRKPWSLRRGWCTTSCSPRAGTDVAALRLCVHCARRTGRWLQHKSTNTVSTCAGNLHSRRTHYPHPAVLCSSKPKDSGIHTQPAHANNTLHFA